MEQPPLFDMYDTIMDLARAAQTARDEGQIAASIAMLDAIFDIIDGAEDALPSPDAPPQALHALYQDNRLHSAM